MAISDRETKEIEAANASGTTPRGLHSRPLALAEQLGQLGESCSSRRAYAPLTPDWPDDPETVEQARANPDVLAKKSLKQIADHTAEVIGGLDKKPAVMGHSTGGLLAADDRQPGPLRSDGRDRSRPIPRRAAAAHLGVALRRALCSRTPSTGARRSRSPWTSSSTAGRTRSTTTRRSSSTRPTTWRPPGVALMQMANANVNPWTEAKVDPENPDRGPLLIIDGEKDHTVPWAIANAAYKRQSKNPSVTEIKKIPNRGHSLTIDHGLAGGRSDRARLSSSGSR